MKARWLLPAALVGAFAGFIATSSPRTDEPASAFMLGVAVEACALLREGPQHERCLDALTDEARARTPQEAARAGMPLPTDPRPYRPITQLLDRMQADDDGI